MKTKQEAEEETESKRERGQQRKRKAVYFPYLIPSFNQQSWFGRFLSQLSFLIRHVCLILWAWTLPESFCHTHCIVSLFPTSQSPSLKERIVEVKRQRKHFFQHGLNLNPEISGSVSYCLSGLGALNPRVPQNTVKITLCPAGGRRDPQQITSSTHPSGSVEFGNCQHSALLHFFLCLFSLQSNVRLHEQYEAEHSRLKDGHLDYPSLEWRSGEILVIKCRIMILEMLGFFSAHLDLLLIIILTATQGYISVLINNGSHPVHLPPPL